MTDVLKIDYYSSGNLESLTFNDEEIQVLQINTKQDYAVKKLQNGQPKMYYTSNEYRVITVEILTKHKSTITDIETLRDQTGNVTLFYDYKDNPAYYIDCKVNVNIPSNFAMGEQAANQIITITFYEVKLLIKKYDLNISRGNASPGSQYHLGKALTLNGSTQVAYINDTSELNIAGEDIILGCMYKGIDTSGYLISKKRTAQEGYGLYLNNGYLALVDGGGNIKATSTTLINDGKEHFCVCIYDESSNTAHFFVNGNFNESVGSITTLVDNTVDLVIGAMRTTGDSTGLDNYLSDNLDEIFFHRYGTNGLYVSGTVGSSGVIRVGTSGGPLIWSDTDSENLVKRLYYSPYSTLTKLGYSSIDDAVRTEVVTNGGFDGDTDWSKTGTWSISAGVASATGDGSNQDLYQLQTPKNHLYVIQYEVTANTLTGTETNNAFRFITDGNYFFKAGYTLTTYLSATVGVHTYIGYGNPDGTTQYVAFRLRSECTGGSISIDNITIKEIGEVARWKFNSDLLDESSNSLDLTGSGDPAYSDNTYINPLMYNSINPHTGTISTWLCTYWHPDDSTERTLFNAYADSDNYLKIYKTTAGVLTFEIYYNGTSSKCEYDITGLALGELHYITCLWSVHTIDGTDYMQLWTDNTERDSVTTNLDIPQSVDATFVCEYYNAPDDWDVLQNFQIEHICWKDTIANAETAGMPEIMSVEYHYNSGSVPDPVINEYTGCLVVED